MRYAIAALELSGSGKNLTFVSPGSRISIVVGFRGFIVQSSFADELPTGRDAEVQPEPAGQRWNYGFRSIHGRVEPFDCLKPLNTSQGYPNQNDSIRLAPPLLGVTRHSAAPKRAIQ